MYGGQKGLYVKINKECIYLFPSMPFFVLHSAAVVAGMPESLLYQNLSK